MNISFIFSNFNRLKDDTNTRYWKNTLIKQNNKKFRVIIVDSQSNNYDFLTDIVDEFRLNEIECELLITEKLDIFNKSLFLNTGAKYILEKYNESIFIFGDVDISYNPVFIDKVNEHYMKNERLSARMCGPTMRTIKRFVEDFPPPSPCYCFSEILDAKPSSYVWRNVAGGCQIVKSSSFLRVGGYNKYMPYCKEDTDFRTKCRGLYGRAIGIEYFEPLIIHLPHEMDEYATNSRTYATDLLNTNSIDRSYRGCDTSEIINVY